MNNTMEKVRCFQLDRQGLKWHWVITGMKKTYLTPVKDWTIRVRHRHCWLYPEVVLPLQRHKLCMAKANGLQKWNWTP